MEERTGQWELGMNVSASCLEWVLVKQLVHAAQLRREQNEEECCCSSDVRIMLLWRPAETTELGSGLNRRG